MWFDLVQKGMTATWWVSSSPPSDRWRNQSPKKKLVVGIPLVQVGLEPVLSESRVCALDPQAVQPPGKEILCLCYW